MILQNQIRCNKCGDEPYSAHRHDFKYCECGSVAVDGGMLYLKRIGDSENYTEISILIPDRVHKDLVETLQWVEKTERNELGAICAIFRVLRDNGYNLKLPESKEIN
jgi:hypothetical protein